MSTTIELTEADINAARKAITSIKKEQEALRERELEIRNYIADALFPQEEGSKTIKIGDAKLSIKRNIVYSITRADAEKLVAEHSALSLDVLSWSPVVKAGGFKKHVDQVSEYITVKAGPPTIEFKD